jgi:hypothetical protein
MQSVYGMTPQAQIATAQAGPTDIGGYTYGSYQGQQNNYNQQVAQNNAITSGLFGLGGAALMAPMTGGTSLAGMGVNYLKSKFS